MTDPILLMILAVLVGNLFMLVRVAYLFSDARVSPSKIRDSLSRAAVRLELQKDL